MRVKLNQLTKRFGKVVGVQDMSLDIRDGEFVAFLGPSGCGKTTTLLMIAGIYKPTSGTIWFDDIVVNQVPPKDRNIGMVFQSYALYPHMTVFGNIAYPLKLKGISKQEQHQRVQDVANTMGIGQLLDRRPAQLSGGQQQRVALGRALVKRPGILLFDEPLSNLDARLRLSMRGEIKHLQRNLGITSIYVTHDQVEAMTMADRIAVMNAGQLEAFDTPADLYERPKTLFVAGFVGNPPMNLLDLSVHQSNGKYVVRHPAFELEVPDERGEPAAAADKQIIMGIRPEDILVTPDGSLAGEVFVVEPLGRDDMLDIRLEDGTRLLTLVDPKMNVKAGEHVKLSLKTENAQFFDPDTGHSLLWRQ